MPRLDREPVARVVESGEHDLVDVDPEAVTFGLGVVDETDGVRTVAFPARLSETPAAVRLRPPELDEHGAEIRRE